MARLTTNALRRRLSPIALAMSSVALLVLLSLAYFIAPSHFAPNLNDQDLRTLAPEQLLAANDDRLRTQNEIRTTSLQLVGGIVVLGGAIATWINVQLRRRDQDIAREGQITERFTRAIDQLGNTDSLDIRLGGIHALERIAKDSPPDRTAIAAVLAAFIRRTAPLTASPENEAPSILAGPAKHTPRRRVDVPLDLQAALTSIGRLQAHEGQQPLKINLRHTDLSNADLQSLDLREANFRRANLAHANLRHANLSGAILVGANLSGAYLIGANLRGTALARTNLREAGLVNADLTDAQLSQADLSNSDLITANLTEAHLRDARLCGADLTTANLTDADLRGVDLTDAVLVEAELIRTQLNEANLTRTDLTRANLSGDDLSRIPRSEADRRLAILTARYRIATRTADVCADLTGATLTDADFSGAQLGNLKLSESQRAAAVGLNEASILNDNGR